MIDATSDHTYAFKMAYNSGNYQYPSKSKGMRLSFLLSLVPSEFPAIYFFTVSDAILLGGKHNKNGSKCIGKAKSSMPNKLGVIDL